MSRRQLLEAQSEEDLLKFQAEFMKSKQAPSAKVVRIEKNVEKKAPEKKVSKFKQQRLESSAKLESIKEDTKIVANPIDYVNVKTSILKKGENKMTEEEIRKFSEEFKSKSRENMDDIETPSILILFVFNQSDVSVLSEVVERDMVTLKTQVFNFSTQGSTTGFPVAHHRTSLLPNSKSSKFNLGADRTLHSDAFMESDDKSTDTIDLKKISKENSDKLKSMSENEIAEAQAELLNSLPPTILAYFRNKKNSPESSQVLTAKNNPEVAAQDMKDVTDSGSVKVTNKLPDRLSELLEDFITNPVGNWRFDLEGSQLNSSEQETLPVHIGLHHHGENPDMAGYTLAELLHLMRSSFPSQFVVACDTMKKIIDGIHSGKYGSIHSVSIFDYLIEAGLLVLLKHALEQSHLSVLCSAATCINSLVAPSYNFSILLSSLLFNLVIWERNFECFRGYESISMTGVPNNAQEEFYYAVNAFEPINSEYEEIPDDLHTTNESGEKVQNDLILDLFSLDFLRIFVKIIHLSVKSDHYISPASCCVSVISRMSFHSPAIAMKISSFLVDTFRKFSYKTSEVTSSLLRLLCILTQSSKEACTLLYNNNVYHNLKFLFVIASEYFQRKVSKSSLDEFPNFQIKDAIYVARIWRVCINFGVDISVALDIMNNLIISISVLTNFSGNNFSSDEVCYIRGCLNILEALVIATSQRTLEDENEVLFSKETVCDSDSIAKLFLPLEYSFLSLENPVLPSLNPPLNLNVPFSLENSPFFPSNHIVSWSQVVSSCEDVMQMLFEIPLESCTDDFIPLLGSLLRVVSVYFEYLPFQPERQCLQESFIESWVSKIFRNGLGARLVRSFQMLDHNDKQFLNEYSSSPPYIRSLPCFLPYDSFLLFGNDKSGRRVSSANSEQFLCKLVYISDSLASFCRLFVNLYRVSTSTADSRLFTELRLNDGSLIQTMLQFCVSVQSSFSRLLLPSAEFIFSTCLPMSQGTLSWRWRYRPSFILFYECSRVSAILLESKYSAFSLSAPYREIWSHVVSYAWVLGSGVGLESYFVQLLKILICNPFILQIVLKSNLENGFSSDPVKFNELFRLLYNDHAAKCTSASVSMNYFCNSVASLFLRHFARHYEIASSLLLSGVRSNFICSFFITPSFYLDSKIRNVCFLNYLHYPLFHLSCIPAEFSNTEKSDYITNLLKFSILVFENNLLCRHEGYIEPSKTFNDIVRGTMEVFLAGSDIFLEHGLYKSLSYVFNLCHKLQNEFNLKISLQSSYWGRSEEFFRVFAKAFFFDSFGDDLFCKCLLLGLNLSEYSNVETRCIIWNEISDNVASIQAEPLFNISNYLWPLETDETVLHEMAHILIEKHLNLRHSPFLYRICIHHLSHYLFKSSILGTKQKDILKNIVTNCNVDIIFSLCQEFVHSSIDHDNIKLSTKLISSIPISLQPLFASIAETYPETSNQLQNIMK